MLHEFSCDKSRSKHGTCVACLLCSWSTAMASKPTQCKAADNPAVPAQSSSETRLNFEALGKGALDGGTVCWDEATAGWTETGFVSVNWGMPLLTSAAEPLVLASDLSSFRILFPCGPILSATGIPCWATESVLLAANQCAGAPCFSDRLQSGLQQM